MQCFTPVVSLDQAALDSLHINYTDIHSDLYTLKERVHAQSVLPLSLIPPPQTHTILSTHYVVSSKPETITGLSAAAQNNHLVACWSSLLLGVSLRAAASVGGISQGFSDDIVAINTYSIGAMHCFMFSLVCIQTSCILSEQPGQST